MGLTQDLLSEPVSKLPVVSALTVSGSTLVSVVIAKMRDVRIGCAIVVDDHGRPDGKFTEHQLAKLLVDQPDFLNQPVGNFIRDYWAQIRHDEPIANLIHKLQTYCQRHVVVVDDDGKATGVVGQRGLMIYLSEKFPRLGKVQSMDSRVAIETREGA